MAKKEGNSLRLWGKRPGLFVDNSRFYILCLTVLLCVFFASYLRVTITNDRVYGIRLQQVYGFLSLGYLYLALLATPLSKVAGKTGAMKHYLHSRRAFGVSAALLAFLHAVIALYGQLGGFGSLSTLPSRFLFALVWGGIGLVILLIMAGISFDKAITWMTFPRWKAVQRLIYVAVVLLFLHVWMIGTHLTYPWVRWVVFGLLTVLWALESWRGALAIEKKSGDEDRQLRLLLAAGLFLLLVVLTWYVPRVTTSYHGVHDKALNHGSSVR